MEEKAQRIVKEIKIKQSSMAFHFLVSVVIRSDHDGGMRVFRHINSLDVVHSIWLNSSQRSETVVKTLRMFLGGTERTNYLPSFVRTETQLCWNGIFKHAGTPFTALIKTSQTLQRHAQVPGP